MGRIITLLIVVLVTFSCKKEVKKQTSTIKVEEVKAKHIETQIINHELIDTFYSNKYLDSLATVKEFEIIEEVDVYEESDSVKVIFMQIANWNDPGDYLKIQIKNSRDSVVFEQVNFGGWMKCVNYYKLSDSIDFFNLVKSDKAIVINNKTGKQLILFGYSYASQPGLMTIIDLFPKPRIIFNKKFDLKSISDLTKTGYRNYIGGTSLSNEVIINMESMKIEK